MTEHKISLLTKEIWVDVQGYEGVYAVSNFGRVMSIGNSRSPRVMRQHKRSRDGYMSIGLTDHTGRKTKKVHRLVAIAFIQNPKNHVDVDHIDGDRSNNNVSNLRWSTKVENMLNRHNSFGVVGVVGVSLSSSKKNPFRAYIRLSGIKKYLGSFKTIEAAGNAREQAYREFSK